MPAKNLTMNQVITVATIRNYVHLHGHAPTLRELAALLDRSRGTTRQRIMSLQRKGVLQTAPRKHRTIEVLQIRPPRAKDIIPPDENDLITYG